MTDKPDVLKVQYHLGRSLLFGPSVRALVLDTLFEIGRSTEQAAALWKAATTDTGSEGDRARSLVEQVTDIRVTVISDARGKFPARES
jgi:hypothetical protein